ncbi:MAG: inverse autotransporter beta domain-containing protein [bacterium]
MIRWAFPVFLFALATLADQSHVESSVPWGLNLPQGRMTMGMQSGDQQTEGVGDFIIPVAASGSRLIFINPRGTWNDAGGREFDLGIGWRQLLPDKKFIAGMNVFYDRRETAFNNRLNQLGGGLEFLSIWVDARANVYLPLDGEKTIDQYSVSSVSLTESTEYWADPTGEGHRITQTGYDNTDVYRVQTTRHYLMGEQAMGGLDAEIGSLLTIPVVRDVMDIKVFVGGYDFNSHHGRDLAGWKGRLEIKPIPAVMLDAGWYEDRELLGSRYSVGVRATLPFDVGNLTRGRNPFAGAVAGFHRGSRKEPFASRLTEMVIRDLHVRSDISPLSEVVADRKETRTLLNHDHHDFHETLATDVTFVSGDASGALQDGTWENPFLRINSGVQNAVGSRIYVRNASQPYNESVVLKEGQALWGSGLAIVGHGNRAMGGIYPVLSADGTGPAITLANNTVVAGMGIVQSVAMPAQVGIYGHDMTGISLHDNIIEGKGRMTGGIVLTAANLPAFRAELSHNTISGASGTGLSINLEDVGTADLVLRENQSTANGTHGVSVMASATTGGARLVLDSLTTSGNGAWGILLNLNAYGGALDVAVHNVTSDDNRYSGLSGYFWGADGLDLSFTGNRMCHNRDSGAMMELYSAATVISDYRDNVMSGNAVYGLALAFDSGLSSSALGRGNRFEENGFLGLGVITYAPTGTYDFGRADEFGQNRFSDNGRWQVLFWGSGELSAQGNWWGTPSPAAGVDYLSLGGSIDASNPVLSP